MVITPIIIMFGSFLPSLGWFATTKSTPGIGADIVMESITVRRAKPA